MGEFLEALGHGDSDAWVTLGFIVFFLGIGVILPVAAVLVGLFLSV